MAPAGAAGAEAIRAQGLIEAVLSEQRVVDGRVFPLVLSPTSCDTPTPKLFETNRLFIEQKLHEHGALFFRGFPLQNPSDFNSVLGSSGWTTLPYIGSAVRTHVVGPIYTANDLNADLQIPFHHEMAHVIDGWPSKVLFYCQLAASQGGQTPFLMSHKVTQQMWAQFPEFMQKLEEQGLRYIKLLTMESDPSHIAQQGWPLVFETTDRKEVEERAMKNFNAKVEWLPDGNLKMVTTPFEATKLFGTRKDQKAWYNKTMLYHTGASHKGGVSPDQPYDVVFGDGSALPADAVEGCRKIHEDNSVDIPWQKGDFMILDNRQVMHGRRAYKPPRQVMVALCE